MVGTPAQTRSGRDNSVRSTALGRNLAGSIRGQAEGPESRPQISVPVYLLEHASLMPSRVMPTWPTPRLCADSVLRSVLVSASVVGTAANRVHKSRRCPRFLPHTRLYRE